MEPITSEKKLFMTFPVEDQDYEILYLKYAPPQSIGSLPSSIPSDEILGVLNFLETVHLKGEESGKRVGGRHILESIRSHCRNLEGIC